MSSGIGRVLFRSIPTVGNLVLCAVAIAYTWNYTVEKRKLRGVASAAQIDEPTIVEFHKKVTESGQYWSNKRVPRPWEDN